MREFSIEKSRYFHHISQAIDLFLAGQGMHLRGWDTNNIDYLISLELSNCFQPWYRPEDIFLIDFAEQRQLIIVAPEHRSWNVSNLGHFLLRMPTFEAIAFLCALEVVMTLERYQNMYISLPMLEELAEGQVERHKRYPYSLSLFGILPKPYSKQRIQVSEFGRSLLTYVKTNLTRFEELFLFLIEAQAAGIQYEEDSEAANLIEDIVESQFLIDDQRKSIETAHRLYKSGDYLDSMRILYPVLEGTLDTVLRIVELEPSSFRGMRSKLEKLEKEGLLSTRMSTGLEIFASRNKIVHGNILENDEELARPLFSLILAYLRRLLAELSETTIR
ncbi:MAG: hypothetical protein KC415_05380 [Anaerolineales bacterium]|nr:hypothetical protein [Anaerolineales bacterium]